jgi:hypothetical protein
MASQVHTIIIRHLRPWATGHGFSPRPHEIRAAMQKVSELTIAGIRSARGNQPAPADVFHLTVVSSSESDGWSSSRVRHCSTVVVCRRIQSMPCHAMPICHASPCHMPGPIACLICHQRQPQSPSSSLVSPNRKQISNRSNILHPSAHAPVQSNILAPPSSRLSLAWLSLNLDISLPTAFH